MAVLLTITSVGPARAQTLPPTGAQVMDRYAEATGGAEAHARLTTRIIRGRMDIPSRQIRGEVTIYQARPSKVYSTIDIAGLGLVERGGDGETLWEIGPDGTARIMKGEERAVHRRGSRFDGDVVWRELFEKAELIEEISIAGEAHYEVELTPESGRPVTMIFNKETGLLARQEMMIDTPRGQALATVLFGDYRAVDGILYAHRTVEIVSAVNQQTISTVTSVEHNVEISPERFEMPAKVKALIGREGAARGDRR